MDTHVADNAGIEPRAAPVLNPAVNTSTALALDPTATSAWSAAQLQQSLLPTYPTIGTVAQGHNPAVGTNLASQQPHTQQISHGALPGAELTSRYADAYAGQFGAFAGFAQVREEACIEAAYRVACVARPVAVQTTDVPVAKLFTRTCL